MIFARPQTQLDQRPRVGDGFDLPAVICLVTPHGFFTGLIPCSGSFSAQVMLANQRFLNGLRSLGINF